MPDAPDWLVREPFTDTDLGPLRSGKEAQIDLVERTGADGRSCLLVRKRFAPRTVRHKGELEALGLQRTSAFRHDDLYRRGQGFRFSRDRRAVERRSQWGRQVLREQWTGNELDVLRRLWSAGVTVPYPVDGTTDELVMEFVGDRHGAAPQLASARLRGGRLAEAWDQLVDALRAMTAIGVVHADLSAFNLLWWDERLWVIDLPQAIDLALHPEGLDLLHRDVLNIATWFARRGLRHDPEAVFADLVARAC